MGFYAPAQIVRDARDHGITVRGVDVNHSDWDCTLEPDPTNKGHRALRLGFREVKGLREEDARRIVAARGDGYTDVRALWRGAGVGGAVLERLAKADAFASLGLNRRAGLWAVKGLGEPPLPLFGLAEAAPPPAFATPEPDVTLPLESDGEAMANDYATIRMSLKHHPLKLLRQEMAARRAVPNKTLLTRRLGRVVVAGLVLVRQRPGTAKGVIFMTLEDETGVANIVVWKDTFERYRKTILKARLVLIKGTLQRQGIVTHVIADHIVDASDRLDALAAGRVEPATAPADEVKRQSRPDPREAAHARRIRIDSRDFH